MRKPPVRSRFDGSNPSLILACGLAGLAATIPLQGYAYEWDTELWSLDLNGQAYLPLGPGWSPILTDIHVGESAAFASKGKAYAGPVGGATSGGPYPAQGELFWVQSFFDVYFDISLSDADPAVSFGGGPDGVSLSFPDNGPAHMENFYIAPADPNQPNFGLLPPPESAPYIGHFTIEIPLGADLNGNGEPDKIKFTLVSHTVNDENRTFIQLPDGTVVDSFDSAADMSGAVVDLSQDPPFGPITLTGPTTASSRLVEIGVPDSGATLFLLVGGAGLLIGWQRVHRRS